MKSKIKRVKSGGKKVGWETLVVVQAPDDGGLFWDSGNGPDDYERDLGSRRQ